MLTERPGISRTTGDPDAQSSAHIKAADHHESAAKAHRAGAEYHGSKDHMKGNEHATEAQKRSKVAGVTPMRLTRKVHPRSSSVQRVRGSAPASIADLDLHDAAPARLSPKVPPLRACRGAASAFPFALSRALAVRHSPQRGGIGLLVQSLSHGAQIPGGESDRLSEGCASETCLLLAGVSTDKKFARRVHNLDSQLIRSIIKPSKKA